MPNKRPAELDDADRNPTNPQDIDVGAFVRYAFVQAYAAQLEREIMCPEHVYALSDRRCIYCGHNRLTG